jgi:hypothetical protein
MGEDFKFTAVAPGPAFPNTVKLFAPQGDQPVTSIILHADGRIEGDAEAVKGWLSTADQWNNGVELILIWLLLKELQSQAEAA